MMTKIRGTGRFINDHQQALFRVSVLAILIYGIFILRRISDTLYDLSSIDRTLSAVEGEVFKFGNQLDGIKNILVLKR